MKFYYKTSPKEYWGFQDAKSLEDVYKKILFHNPEIKKEDELRISKVDSRRIHVYYPKSYK